MSHTDATPCSTVRLRSSPAPVSMLGFGSGEQLAVGLRVELHEHEVPDLEVAVFALRRSAAGAELGAEVVEDLRGRAARAGVAHRPEVVGVAQALDPLGRQADDVGPDALGFVVGVVHRDPDPIGIELEDLGDAAPTPTGSLRP